MPPHRRVVRAATSFAWRVDPAPDELSLADGFGFALASTSPSCVLQEYIPVQWDKANRQMVSSFTNEDGLPIVVKPDTAVFTVCARDDMKTGGHAYCYIETFTGQKVEMIRWDLVTPGHGRIQLSTEAIQVIRLGAPDNINEVDNELRHYDTTKHHSYHITADQADRLVVAFDKFNEKVRNGRYVYSLPGGLLGRVLGALSGQRGVNCADLIFKLLNDAGIVHVEDKLFNTPRYAAGSSKKGREGFVDLP